MNAREFLDAFAAELGADAPSAEEMRVLLDVAAIAAHGSERIAAPLACWLGGRSGRPVGELLAAAQRVAPGVE